MPFVSSNNRPIYYERHGEGPVLLFCHGAGSNAATWWQQLPVFARHYTCLTMDIRCFGRSGAPMTEFSLQNFTEDALAVLEHAQAEKAVVIGQSLGGMIGLRLALHHADRICGFVACDSSLAIDHPELLRIVENRLTNTGALSVEQRSMGSWFLSEQPALAGLYGQINRFNPSTHSVSRPEWQTAMATLIHQDSLTPADALSAIQCPMLFLIGDTDPFVPVPIMQELAAKIPSCRTVVIEQAGHSAYFERPDAFNRHVLAFLENHIPKDAWRPATGV